MSNERFFIIPVRPTPALQWTTYNEEKSYKVNSKIEGQGWVFTLTIGPASCGLAALALRTKFNTDVTLLGTP